MVYGFIFRSFFLLSLVFLSLHAKEDLSSYLIPEDHSIKASLDKLFHSSRCTFNLETMKQAGFKETFPRKFTKVLVTSHPFFPGYIFKLYLDVQRPHKNWEDYKFWVLRVQGAKKVQKLIEKMGWGDSFKVPQKWLYALPKVKSSSTKEYATKSYLLIVEDMEILSTKDNLKYWSSNQVTPEILEKLHYLLKEVGFSDCAKPDNIPFSKDGRIAFIDTQTFGKKVPFNKLTKFLSSSNQQFWKQLK